MRPAKLTAVWVVAAAIVASSLGAPPPAATLAPGSAAAVSGALAERIAERARREMDEQSLVALGLALVRDEAIVHEAYFGFEDREAGIHATADTMFRWASVSKPLAAVVAMQLEREGRLDLDADVRKLVPEFPEKPFVITARQLLGHLGGVVHYSNGPVIRTQREYADPHPFKDVIVALDTFRESPLVCEPGERYEYTTHGYILLSAQLQRAGGKPFAELVTDRVARPLGMTTLRPDYQWERIPRRAKGYRRVGATPAGEPRPQPRPSTDTDVSWKLGGGGWISTVGDMARFGAGMLGTRLVDPAERERMWTAQTTRAGESTGYGLGFNIEDEPGGPRRIAHSGSQEKASTYLLIVPDAQRPGGGVAVAVMCSTEGVRLRRLALSLASMIGASAAPGEPLPVEKDQPGESNPR